MDRTPFAVIMAGGTGTRFWPASRRARPKQFLDVLGRGGGPMLAATRRRLRDLVPDDRVLVVAGQEHAGLVREALPGLPRENLLLEPVGRNTLACVALANAEVRRRDPDAVQVVLPADHVISPEDGLRAVLQGGIQAAEASLGLVTFGVRPTHAATGYGYVEIGPATGEAGSCPVHEVLRFVEKPDRARAERFLSDGRFLWNSGMFAWTTGAVTAALEEHAGATWNALREARPGDLPDLYPALESLSVDVALLERAATRRVIPVELDWCDVGSWDALVGMLEADAADNRLVGGGKLEALDTTGSLVYAAPGELVALIGVRDLVVVHTPDATLVCPRERAEEVRELVARLERSDPDRL